MPAAPSKLQLKSYFLKELSYFLKDSLTVEPSGGTHDKPVELEITDVTTPLEGKSREWRCELSIKSSNPDKSRFYDFRIVIIGFFVVDSHIDDDTAQMIAESNAPAVLYSTSREIVATVTRRSPYPATLLPAVTFIKDLVNEKQVPKVRTRAQRKPKLKN